MCLAPASAWCSISRVHRGALALVLLAVATGAGAAGPSLAVRVAGPAVIEAANRQTLSIALACESFDTADRTVAIAPRFPDGWKAVWLGAEFTLAPGAADVRIVSFLVPAEAPAGEYPLGFELRDAADPSVTAECGIVVVVRPTVAFSLSLLDAPAFVLAGEEYESVFLLQNDGNVELSVDLEVDCGQALPCRLLEPEDGREVALPRGGRRAVRIAVRTQPGIPHSTRHPVRVLARVHGQETGEATPPASAASIVEVIPLSLGTGSLMHTIPLTFLTTAGMTFSPAVAGIFEESISASGTLDEAGAHRLELAIRKQFVTGQDPWYSDSDRYSLRYEHRLGEVTLGDGAYSLSPLLVMDEYARGVGGTLVMNPIRLGAILYRNVWSTDGNQGVGGSLDYTIHGRGSGDDFVYRVGLGALWPFTDHAIVGLWQQYRPLANLGFQLDAALDIGPGGMLNPALFALASGGIAGVSWNLRFLRAGPGFTGEHEDTQSIAAAARAALLDGTLTLDAAFSLVDDNLLPDVSRPAERAVSFSLGATGDVPGWNSEAAVRYGLVRDVDRLPVPDFQRWEHRVQAEWKQWFRTFTPGLASSITWTLDDLTGTLLTSQKHLLSFEVDPSKEERYDVSLSWGRERTDRLMPNDSIGLDARALVQLGSAKLRATLGNTWSYGRTGITSFRFDLGAGYAQTFPWGHTLAAQAAAAIAYEALAWSPDGSFSIGYGVPVDVPVGRKKDVSVIRGTVIRAETGEPQQDVVLRVNGLASATDSAGRFTFYVPRSGRLYLQMDNRTLGRGLIPAQPMPRELTVASGSTTTVDLAVVAGCTVAGSVVAYGDPAGPAACTGDGTNGDATTQLQRIGGLGSLVVELSNGSERMRRVTGTDGRFVFGEVRPGAWTIAVVAGNLPTYHSLEQPAVPLELVPGERREIEFKVIQERRRITMLDAGISVVTVGDAGAGREFTATSGGAAAPQPETGTPVTIAEAAPIEAAPVQPISSEPIALAPSAVEPAPVETSIEAPAAAEQPAPAEQPVAPELPAEPAQSAPAAVQAPARTVRAATEDRDPPSPTWDEILEAWGSLPFTEGQLPASEFTAPADVVPTVVPAPTVPAAAPVAPVATTPAAPATAPTAPAPAPGPGATPPVTPPVVPPTIAVPAPAPSPTPPPITIPIPLPMPTPRPPVTLPGPSPTPQPFPP